MRLNFVLKGIALGPFEKMFAFMVEGLSTHPQIN